MIRGALKQKIDYLVIGGGFAGSNAVAGIKKVNPAASVLCVDKHAAAGGSWNDYYPFVKLHAPHPHFGVNGHKWPYTNPSTLAGRDDILSHFQSYMDNLGEKSLFAPQTEFLAFDSGQARLKDGEGEYEVSVEKNVINASGFNYRGHTGADECKHSNGSLQGKEISVQDLPESLKARTRDRLYVVVGGGKTGMDAALWLGKHKDKSDELVLVTGSNKCFVNRQTTFPDKHNIKYSDPSALEHFLSMAVACDGTAASCEKELLRMQDQGTLIKLGGANDEATTFMFGSLGEDEKKAVEEAARIIANDHVVGVNEEGNTLFFRKGGELHTDKEIVLVSCRSSLTERANPFHYPLHPMRPDGTLNFGALLGFTGPTNYLLSVATTHDPAALGDIQLYGFRENFHGNSTEWPFLFSLMIMVNTLNAVPKIGVSGLASHTLDFNQWYPLPRQVYSFGQLLSQRAMLREKADKLLRRLEPYEASL